MCQGAPDQSGKTTKTVDNCGRATKTIEKAGKSPRASPLNEQPMLFVSYALMAASLLAVRWAVDASWGSLIELCRAVLFQSVVCVLIFAAVLRYIRWHVPNHRDPLGLADLICSVVIYPVLSYLALAGAWGMWHGAQSRWNGLSYECTLFQQLYITRCALHITIVCKGNQRPSEKAANLVHHFLSIAGFAGGLLSGSLGFFACLDGCCEVTNIFLTNVFLWKEFTINGKSLESMLPKMCVVFNGALLWLSYLFMRIILFPVWIYVFYKDAYYFPELGWNRVSNFEAYVDPMITVFLFVLSLMWFIPITAGLLKVIRSSASSAAAAAKEVKAVEEKASSAPATLLTSRAGDVDAARKRVGSGVRDSIPTVE